MIYGIRTTKIVEFNVGIPKRVCIFFASGNAMAFVTTFTFAAEALATSATVHSSEGNFI